MKSILPAALGFVLLASCASGDNTSSGPRPQVQSSQEDPSEDREESPSRCPNPEGGLANVCLGNLKAGRYKTKSFEPTLGYTVPAGWRNLEDLPGNFLLLPPGATLQGVNAGTGDYLGVYTSVAAPQKCNGLPNREIRTVEALTQWLTSNPRLIVSNVHDVSVGGLDGHVMDILMKKSDGCDDGVFADIYSGIPPSDLIHGVIPNYLVRAYLLRYNGGALAIELSDAKGPRGSDYKNWPKAATKVIDTFKFGGD